MASISTPVLTITGSPTPGQSAVKVEYEITFNAFDKSSDQPYVESVKLIGDDTGVAGDPAAAAPDDALVTMVPIGFPFPRPSTVRASQIVAPATTLKRSFSRTYVNSVLNEDQAPIPNPDELRATVTLTPQMPVATGPIESNLVTLAL